MIDDLLRNIELSYTKLCFYPMSLLMFTRLYAYTRMHVHACVCMFFGDLWLVLNVFWPQRSILFNGHIWVVLNALWPQRSILFRTMNTCPEVVYYWRHLTQSREEVVRAWWGSQWRNVVKLVPGEVADAWRCIACLGMYRVPREVARARGIIS